MSARAFYNDIDPIACAVLRELIIERMIPEGDVDDRSIADIQADDLVGYTQIHLFAGAGGWPLALRLVRWPDDKPVLTGSCPCQPFSCAGKQKGCEDERHLWPEMLRLISELLPAICLGEQVASKAGRDWFTRVRLDLEGLGYAVGAADLCAAGQGKEVSVLLAGQDGLREARVFASTPHIRQRLFWGAIHMEKPHVLLTEQFAGQGSRSPSENGAGARREPARSGSALWLPDTNGAGLYGWPKDAGWEKGRSARTAKTGIASPMADTECIQCERWREPRQMGGSPSTQPCQENQQEWSRNAARDCGENVPMEHPESNGRQLRGAKSDGRGEAGRPGGNDDRMRNPIKSGLEGFGADIREQPGHRCGGESPSETGTTDGLPCGLANRDSSRRQSKQNESGGNPKGNRSSGIGIESGQNSLWSDFDIVICRDKTRDGIPKVRRIPRQAQSGLQRVVDGIPYVVAPDSAQGNSEAQCRKEVSTYPLAEAEAWKGSRVGLLRLIGNAIDPRLAAEFIQCFMETVS